MSIDLQALGITKEELQERVIERAVQRVFESKHYDEDGDYVADSPFAKKLQTAVKSAIDKKVAEIAEKHVLPMVGQMVENLTLQQTNGWGEKTGKSITFIEYLVQRADAYLREDVNFEGKGKTEANGYSWNKAQTRLTHLVHQHLHFAIESSMKDAVTKINAAIAPALADTVKTKLSEITKGLQVAIETRR